MTTRMIDMVSNPVRSRRSPQLNERAKIPFQSLARSKIFRCWTHRNLPRTKKYSLLWTGILVLHHYVAAPLGFGNSPGSRSIASIWVLHTYAGHIRRSSFASYPNSLLVVYRMCQASSRSASNRKRYRRRGGQDGNRQLFWIVDLHQVRGAGKLEAFTEKKQREVGGVSSQRKPLGSVLDIDPRGFNGNRGCPGMKQYNLCIMRYA